MKIEQIKTKELVPYARNSRTHSEQQVSQIAGSIKEFGFTNPVLIDADNGIIAGHGRVMGAQVLSMEKVPCIRLKHLTEAQTRAYVIADNKLAMNAGWDDELLSLELIELQEMDFDLSITGFDENELAELLAEETEGLTDEDDVPDAPENPVTVEGDVWKLGRHRLMCGDCTSVSAVEKLMAGKQAQLCFTSPPYSDQREYNGGKELSTEHLATFIGAASNLVEYFAVNLGYSRKDGEVNQYWDDYINESRMHGNKLLSWNVWDRSNLGGSIGNQTAFFPIWHEWIFVFGKSKKEINRTNKNKHAGERSKGTNRQSDGSSKASTGRVIAEYGKIGTVTSCGVSDGKLHPAMFPVELPSEYICAMTNKGDFVYEPFCGSGTTVIACEKDDRQCRCMELDPKYCDVIIKRWQEFTGKDATQAESGKTYAELKSQQEGSK